MRRAFPLRTGETYHIYSKSIYHYVIFPTDREYRRIIDLVRYFREAHRGPRFSHFIDTLYYKTHGFEATLNRLHPRGEGGLVEIKAYCLMPTHVHFILHQVQDEGIRIFMSHILTSFSLYFNYLHNRNGPLWQGRFGAARIRDHAHFLEKLDYVHNNPVKDLGFKRPDDWIYSSFRELHGLDSPIPNLLHPGGGGG